MRDTRTVAVSDREEKVTRWLSPVDASSNYIQAHSQCHPGTGQWFLESGQYRKWTAKSINSLWLHGIPGCGKSVLSSTIIEDLQRKVDTSEQALLYFFFDFVEPDKQNLDKMLRSLIFRLCQQHASCYKRLDQVFASCQNGREQPSIKSLVAILDSMIAEVGNVKIVLDALDECRTRRELLSWLASLSRSNVQMLVTSRKEEDIESSLTMWMPLSLIVPLQQAAVDDDIRAVVRSKLATDEDLQRWRSMPDVCKKIEKELMAKAGGM